MPLIESGGAYHGEYISEENERRENHHWHLF